MTTLTIKSVSALPPSADRDKTLEWLKSGKASRCRAAERIAEVLSAVAPPQPPAVILDGVAGDPMLALQKIRVMILQWRGEPHVCGRAFGLVNRIDELLKKY